MDRSGSPNEIYKLTNSADAVAYLLSQAANNSTLSQAATSTILMKYTRARVITVSGPQDTHAAEEASVRFQALQCAQNERIIELLEKLNAAKK